MHADVGTAYGFEAWPERAVDELPLADDGGLILARVVGGVSFVAPAAGVVEPAGWRVGVLETRDECAGCELGDGCGGLADELGAGVGVVVGGGVVVGHDV